MLWVYGHYNFFFFGAGNLSSRRQILTSEVGPHAEQVKLER